MYRELRLSSHKGLKECCLRDLGRVNVICGRNNSGKTTLLEAVNSREHRAVGRRLTEEDAQRIVDTTHVQMGWSSEKQDLKERYLSVVREVCARKAVWYSDQADQFVELVGRSYDESPRLRQWSFGMGAVAKCFSSLFSDEYRPVLVPPKRAIDVETKIDTAQRVQPAGGGVLNALFFAKNQSVGSAQRDHYDKLGNAFKRVSCGYDFQIVMGQKNTIRLNFSREGSDWLSADDSGLGLQDLLVLLYFAISEEFDVVLIEEPESHLHADMQRRLLQVLREQKSKQFFISTHSNVFLSASYVDRVYFTHFDGTVEIDDATSRAAVLYDLGYDVTDNLVSDLVILTEGPSDIPVIQEYLLKIGLLGPYSIKVWPLGGDIMDQIDLSVLAEGYRVTAMVDQDPGSNRVRERFISNCELYNIPVHRLDRYAIENYFSLRAMREVFAAQVPDEVTELDTGTSVEGQLGFNVKKNNRRLAKEMTLEEIEGTDLYEFLQQVKSLCEESVDAEHAVDNRPVG